MKKIAVVILNWNGSKLLEQFLPSVIKFSNEANIYVADNASTDGSIALIESRFPSVTIIQNPKNYGFAKGYNQALEQVSETYLALVNSDIEVTENWLQPILQTFENESKIAIIQPKILDFKNKKKFEYAGAAGGFIDQYGYPFCRGRILDWVEPDLHQYDLDCTIFWASGACFFIRNSVFKALGGFDSDFFAHQEEIDLCWRAFNKGYQIKFIHKSVVFHVGGATLQQGNPKKTFLNFRNSLLMLTKNLPKSDLVPILFFRLILDGIAGIHFLFKGKINHTFAVIRAHFSFYSLFFKTIQKRDTVQEKNYYKTKSIVFEYYLKNGKVFGKIK